MFFGGAAPLGALIVANNNNNSGRFLIGGQAGYNWQINNFVLGIEGDGDVAIGRTTTSPASSILAPIRASSRLCAAGEVSPLTASSSTAQAVSPSATAETSATHSSAPPLVGRPSSRRTLAATRLSATLSVQVLNTPSSTIGALRPSTSSPISAQQTDLLQSSHGCGRNHRCSSRAIPHRARRPELQVQLGRLWCRSTGCRTVLNDAGLLAGASALQAETGYMLASGSRRKIHLS